MSFWQGIKRYWQQLDHQLRQAAIIYIVFAICAILLQMFFNIADLRADVDGAEAIAVIGAVAGESSRSGVIHKVDLTDLSLALDQEIVAKLGFDRRDPGVAAIPAHHSWQMAVRQAGDVEWHWTESSHQYDLSETYGLADSTEGRSVSVEDLRQTALAVKEHWTDGSGREVTGSLSRENGMMILNLELKMKPAQEESAPLLTMSKLQIRLRSEADVAAGGGAGLMDGTNGWNLWGAEGAGDIGIADPAKGGEAQSASVTQPGSETEHGVGTKPGAGEASETIEASKRLEGSGTPGKTPIPGGSVGDQPGRSARPKICIILDDGGEATPDVAEEFWKLGTKWPLVVAVLPFSPYSREQAEMAKSLGYEVMLHLPMEPIGSENPGMGAILTELSDAEILERVQAALAAVPQAIGVNNHMGSKASSDPRVMQLVLSEIRRNNLFFVDSVSIASSVGYREALSMGIPTAKRHVFLDNVTTEEAVLKQLEELVRVARLKGVAIGIGHLNRVATARALALFLPRLEEMGIDLVPITEIVK